MLEMAALRRMRPATFGIWMSLEPAIASMLGALMTASAGAVLTAARTVQVADAP